MKPHPRIRKAIKWGGAAVTVLLVVVWIGSGWIWVQLNIGNRTLNLGRGFFSVATFSFPRYDCHAGVNSQAEFVWKPSHWEGTTILPFWLLLAPVLMIALAAWRLDAVARRRARLNLCPKCSYDRAGIARDAKCPECGAMPAVPALPSR